MGRPLRLLVAFGERVTIFGHHWTGSDMHHLGNSKYVLPLFPIWISEHMPSQVLGEITYPFPTFNGFTVEVWKWKK